MARGNVRARSVSLQGIDRPKMPRLFTALAFLAILSGCASTQSKGPEGLRVAATSSDCGTPSQQADLKFFENASDFERWVNNRSIRGFQPILAAERGIIIVEMGQRPTGGYDILLDAENSFVEGETLTIAANWISPRDDAAVSQALVAPCLAIRPPDLYVNKFVLVDQLREIRGQVDRK